METAELEQEDIADTRDIVKTIELMIAATPPNRTGFIGDLQRLKSGCVMLPPKRMPECWQLLRTLVTTYINEAGILTYEWMAKVVAIFADRSVEEIVNYARTHR